MKGIGVMWCVRLLWQAFSEKGTGGRQMNKLSPLPGDVLGLVRASSTWTVTNEYDKSYVQSAMWTPQEGCTNSS